MYGQTEAAPRVTWLPPDRVREKIGSIGIEVPGVTVEVMGEDNQGLPAGKEGELVVSGDNVMMGYWNQPDEQRQVLRNGKLYTGDLGYRDEDGFLFIVGRKKEIIKTGGNRVSPKEIEERLAEHEAVVEAAVVGVEDEILGEAVKAFIVSKPDQDLSERDLRIHCKGRLADHKIPKFFEFLDSLPKYQSGKVDKTRLKLL